MNKRLQELKKGVPTKKEGIGTTIWRLKNEKEELIAMVEELQTPKTVTNERLQEISKRWATTEYMGSDGYNMADDIRELITAYEQTQAELAEEKESTLELIEQYETEIGKVKADLRKQLSASEAAEEISFVANKLRKEEIREEIEDLRRRIDISLNASELGEDITGEGTELPTDVLNIYTTRKQTLEWVLGEEDG